MEPHRSVFVQAGYNYPPQNTPLTKQRRPLKGGRLCCYFDKRCLSVYNEQRQNETGERGIVYDS